VTLSSAVMLRSGAWEEVEDGEEERRAPFGGEVFAGILAATGYTYRAVGCELCAPGMRSVVAGGMERSSREVFRVRKVVVS